MIRLIKEYTEGPKEGVRTFHCGSCGHDYNVGKDNKRINCFYCGCGELDITPAPERVNTFILTASPL